MKQNMFIGWLLGALLVACVPLFAFAQTTSPSVMISEIAWAGSSLSNSDEWIELVNLSETSADISGWQLSGAASSDNLITIPDETILEPGALYLIANYSNEHENAAHAIAPNLVTSSLSLSNSSLHISLLNETGAVVDLAGDGTAPFAGVSAGSADSDGFAVSLERVVPFADGSIADSWQSSVESMNYREGILDLGTPGVYTNASLRTVEEIEEVEEEVVAEDAAEDAEPIEEVVEIETPVIVIEEVDASDEEVVDTEELEEIEVVLESADETPALRITEFVSDPSEGAAEFVEIQNVSDQTISLLDYQLIDTAGKATVLPEHDLAPLDYYVIDSPLGKLNNDGDTITLLNPDSEVVAEVVYGTDDLPTLPDPYAYALDADGFFLATTTSTPGRDNVFTEELPVVEEVVEESEGVEELSQETPELEELEVAEEVVALSSYQSGDVMIMEFVSDPLEGEEEWIELLNMTNEAIDLTEWTVVDAADRATVLEGSLAPHSYHLVVKPKGVLNNGGDTIVVKDAHDVVIDEVVYGTELIAAPEKGQSIAKMDDGAFMNCDVPTPGAVNVCETVEETGDDEEISQETSELEGNDVDYSFLRISEIYPNTDGTDAYEEFVEIENAGSYSVNLQGIIVEDTSGKQFVITDSYDLQNVALYTLWRDDSGIALNNLGDTVRLLTPDNSLIDEVTYEKAKKGSALARINGVWDWTTTPTPGTANEYVVALEQTETTNTTTTTTSTTSVADGSNTASGSDVVSTSTESVLIADILSLPDGEDVTIEGLVLVSPSTLGKQFFYLADQTVGVQVYSYHADFPALSQGQRVRVHGELSTNGLERRVKISSADAIDVLSSHEAYSYWVGQTDDLSRFNGQLITVSGIVSEKSGNTITLESDGDEMLISLSSYTGLSTALFERGATAVVTGVVRASKDTWKIYPRTKNDISMESADSEELVPVASGVVGSQNQSGMMGQIIFFGALAILLGLFLRASLPTLRESYVRRRSVRLASQATG